MNVNGSRFDLLLGRADFGRCLDGDGEHALTLASWWETNVLPAGAPAWDDDRNELIIPPVILELTATPGEAQLALDARRGAAADRHGNVYWIGAQQRTLHVSPAGSRRAATLWPPEPDSCRHERAQERVDFAPSADADPGPDETYRALAVTHDDYLVVAFTAPTARGFLSFDLVAGGPPTRTLWPDLVPFEPVDMAARAGGGVWVLDRASDPTTARLWELDCRLTVVTAAQPVTALAADEPDDFQPTSGPPRIQPARSFPGGIELRDHTVDAIAVESTGEHTVLLLDRDVAGNRARVVRLRRTAAGWQSDPSQWLHELRDGVHDFVFAGVQLFMSNRREQHLVIATSGGNQARAYVIDDDVDFELHATTELLPLRRFTGRALVSVRGSASYDSGADAPLWTPIAHQPRARFATHAEFVTPVFDSHDIGTVWDRVLLDACIPPDAAVEVWSRAGDELLDGAASPAAPAQVVALWRPEPRPHLRSTGAELPWLRREAAPVLRRDAGAGTWELLLQQAHGRYLQLRVRLSTPSGLATPRLRALRVWAPRFSYPQRFLPAIYRQEPISASLLERWLANMESTLTQIEDRIVNVQSLFDPRTAPAETLEWLAAWLDVALDPAWDERRRRLFIAYAMEFFRWRGTVHGIWLALELAFNDCFDRAAFDAPGRSADVPHRIRIVEAYQTRVLGALVSGDPGASGGPREMARTTHWTAAEGIAGLVDRWAEFTGASPSTALATPFPLYDALDGDQERHRTFLQGALGFIPAAASEERAAWRDFHVAQYGSPAALRAEHGVEYESFAAVPLPRDWPAQPGYADDWRAFVTSRGGPRPRTRWQHFLARRYRRIERLNRAHGTAWPSFDVVALPDVLPASTAAQTDWLQFEKRVLPMHRTAHRFSVLLPVADVATEPYQLEHRLGLAQRIVALEKPAHTVFDVRYYWAFFRVAEARLGLDTLLGAGSRAPELIPAAVLGRAYMGASFVGGVDRPRDGDRLLLTC
jgi:phage tail-like protein